MKNYKYYFLDYYNLTVFGSEVNELLTNRINSIVNNTMVSTIYLCTTIESIKKRFKKQETMNKQREFKVGDKCVVEYTVAEIDTTGSWTYPIECIDNNGRRRTFTKEGVYSLDRANKPSLKHIEDIAPKPEFPKWMMVVTGDGYKKRFVIYKDESGFVFVSQEGSYVNNGISWTSSAKEIEPENNKLQELEKKHKELGLEIEKLKNQL